LKPAVIARVGLLDLQSLALVSKAMKELCEGECDRRVDALYTGYHLDTRRMPLVLKTYRACISGSAALAIVDPGIFTPDNLDVYVPRTHAVGLLKHVTETSQWRRMRDDQLKVMGKKGLTEYTELPGIAAIWYLQHPATTHLINIIVTETKCVSLYRRCHYNH
jgi:hypothetical protein